MCVLTRFRKMVLEINGICQAISIFMSFSYLCSKVCEVKAYKLYQSVYLYGTEGLAEVKLGVIDYCVERLESMHDT